MSNMKHTPEPWEAYDNSVYWEILSEGHSLVSVFDNRYHPVPVTKESTAANAARIVACVNAMAGIEEPQAFRDSLQKLSEYADKASEMFAEKDAKIKQLYTAAENLWQTLNALQMVVGVHLDQDTRKQIKEALANNNPSNYSA